MTQTGMRRFLIADVRCHLCGRMVGTMRQEQAHGAAPEFTSGQTGECTIVQPRARLCCSYCGGPVYTETPEVIREYAIEKDPIGKRRGRPPKHLARSE